MLLDKAGPFERSMQGSLTKDAFLLMRRVVATCVLNEFKPKKEELMAKRLEAFKTKQE